MRQKIRIAVVLALLTVLTGCVSYKGIEPGQAVAVGNGITVDPQVKWAKMNYGGTGGTLWTINGYGLDELNFFLGVKPGKTLIKARGRSAKDFPVYQKALLPNEVMELLASTLTKLGYAQVRTSGLAPAPFGTANGFRFNLDFAAPSGLEMKGVALLAQRNDILDLILFAAPAEYYFGEQIPIVERIFASIRLAKS